MTELKDHEYQTINTYLHEAGQPQIGKCKIYWDDKTYFGAYHPLGDYITLMPKPDMLKLMTPCLAHELCHYRQRHRWGLIIFAIVNLTRTVWEWEAVENEKETEKKLNIKL